MIFLKGLIIGIGKIIPGVSGAMLAINFNVYHKTIEAIVNFFDDWKKNLKFILLLGGGIFLAIVFGSKIVIYLLDNYYFLTMMLFIGLIIGGTYNFFRNIEYKSKDIVFILFIVILFFMISCGNISNNYVIKGNFFDKVLFFMGGFIEIMASIIPGISGTALQMLLGIYDKILVMISSIFDISYVLRYFDLYLSFGVGMFISLVVNILLVNYCLKRHLRIFNLVILGLSISSILMLFLMVKSVDITLLDMIMGIVLLVIGMMNSCILN